jgi:hypothetical protein
MKKGAWWIVVLAIVIIAVALIIIFSKTTGYATNNQGITAQGGVEQTCEELKELYGEKGTASCTDTDGGNTPNTAGITYGFANGIWFCEADKCQRTSMTEPIMEYYCVGNKMERQVQYCRIGVTRIGCGTYPEQTANACKYR